MKLQFIYNPTSGKNRRRPWLPRHIRDFSAARGLDAAFATTQGPGHATELAQDAVANGCDRVVAVGGDGTMNEIAQALVHTRAALALVPCGSGNGLARHLRLPTNAHAALELATDPAARVAAIDTGVVNGWPFFNAMGSGFDAEISRRFNRLARRGLAAYLRTGLQAFRQRRAEHILVRVGATRLDLDVLLVTTANSDQYGNGALIAPGARVDDGWLDLVAVRPVSLVSALPLIARLFLGRMDGSPDVVRLRGHRIEVQRTRGGVIHTDGETHDADRDLCIEVRPRSLRLVVPPHAPVAGHVGLIERPSPRALPSDVARNPAT